MYKIGKIVLHLQQKLANYDLRTQPAGSLFLSIKVFLQCSHAHLFTISCVCLCSVVAGFWLQHGHTAHNAQNTYCLAFHRESLLNPDSETQIYL